MERRDFLRQSGLTLTGVATQPMGSLRFPKP